MTASKEKAQAPHSAHAPSQSLAFERASDLEMGRKRLKKKDNPDLEQPFYNIPSRQPLESIQSYAIRLLSHLTEEGVINKRQLSEFMEHSTFLDSVLHAAEAVGYGANFDGFIATVQEFNRVVKRGQGGMGSLVRQKAVRHLEARVVNLCWALISSGVTLAISRFWGKWP